MAAPVDACGAVLSSPGSYVLSTDLACTGAGAAISITSPGVDLDLGGHTLTGDSTAGGIGVAVTDVSDVHVHGGTLASFSKAVAFDGATTSRITGLTVTGDWPDLDHFYAVELHESTDNVVTGNSVTGYLFAFEIEEFSLRNVLRHNTATGNQVGVDLVEDAHDNVIELNDLSGNTETNAQGGDDVSGNRFAGNDLSDAGDDGFRSFGIDFVDNVIVGNTIRNNGRRGLSLSRTTSANLYENNLIIGNGHADPTGVDIRDQAADEEDCVQTYVGNVFRTDSEGDGPSAGCIQGRTPLPPSVTTTTLPPATLGTPYAADLTAQGDVPPFTWTIAAGSLPPGLALAPSGRIAGTPTGTGVSTFTVRVTDDDAPAATSLRSLAITVGPRAGSCEGLTGTLVGTSAAETLVGTPGDDVIIGGGGLDRLVGLGGDDVLCAGSEATVLRGGSGDDRLVGGDGGDVLAGGSGDGPAAGRRGRGHAEGEVR